jgi:glycosyltransferase involved in cell wall biosynthesis
MIIGFDAKRAFQNRTGLGNYSRTLLYSLDEYFNEHDYLLFAPKRTSLFEAGPTMRTITPDWQPAKQFKSLWRSWWVTRDLIKANTQIYHGLSNEIPVDIHKTGIRSVVTIHDLIFELYPQQYDKTEVWTYRKKFRNACRHADVIIATSQNTKKDIVAIYNISPDKIHVCYQSCSEDYWQPLSEEALSQIRTQYQLPSQYFLYVGSITERKNLMAICEALYIMRGSLNIPLVVVGEGKQYKRKVQEWLNKHGMQSQVIFLSDTSKGLSGYQSGSHFPAIYQNATALVFPSVYEGFGIPILEAMVSGIPVIASNTSSLPEVGGGAALYFSPGDIQELCNCMQAVVFNESVRNQCRQNAKEQVQQFTRKKSAEAVMQVYRSLL